MKMCRDPEDAKDVLQDTLLAMARGVRDFRGASSLSTWLYTIARSFCIKKRRRSKFAPEEERSLDTDLAAEARHWSPPRATAPDEALAGRQVERALEQAIAALEPMYREVLLLRDVEGLTAPEVAEVVGASVQAVKSRLHRARLSVRERVAPLLGVEAPPPAPERCPDVLMMFSRHLEDEISADVAPRWSDTSRAARGAAGPATRSSARSRSAAPPAPPCRFPRPFRPRSRRPSATSSRRMPEPFPRDRALTSQEAKWRP